MSPREFQNRIASTTKARVSPEDCMRFIVACNGAFCHRSSYPGTFTAMVRWPSCNHHIVAHPVCCSLLLVFGAHEKYTQTDFCYKPSY